MLHSINYFITLFLETFKLFGRIKAWLLLLCLVFVNWLLLYSHYNFTDPLFYSVVTWWTELWDPQYAGGFTHYPGHFILLSYYFNEARWFVSLLIEGSILGAVAVIFYKYIFTETDSPKNSIQENVKNWMHLTLGWSFINCLLYAGYKFLPKIFAVILSGSPRRQMIFDYGVIPFFNIIVVAIFFFTIPYIAIYRTNVINGLNNSIKIFLKRPIFMLFLSTSILIAPIFISFLLSNPAELVDKFEPSIVFWFLLAGIGFDLFVNFFWMGTAVNFLSDEE